MLCKFSGSLRIYAFNPVVPCLGRINPSAMMILGTYYMELLVKLAGKDKKKKKSMNTQKMRSVLRKIKHEQGQDRFLFAQYVGLRAMGHNHVVLTQPCNEGATRYYTTWHRFEHVRTHTCFLAVLRSSFPCASVSCVHVAAVPDTSVCPGEKALSCVGCQHCGS